MDMKKISCVALVAAASLSAALAATEVPAPAPGPGVKTSGSSATLPIFGSLVGASILSFLALFQVASDLPPDYYNKQF
ncbi:Arabinogalactan peptide 23-like [Quillaja saponaria]|uniref:Arabinogalactan peptide 23-like n=1 Tax=Quillaja saponaria TaxID=32244 RepID=A0AAD7VDX2_QUISA|nr:Arabinogalactan peptide 23-like [Quillaja saponaria]